MEQEVYSWIRNIVIYMLMNTVILNLLGNKSYKKYVSIVSGMILVIIVVSPLIKLLKLEDKLDYYLEFNDYSIETSDFKNELKVMEAKQTDEIFSEYEKQIKEQVEQLLLEDQVKLKNCKITLDRNAKSSTYGKMIGISITAAVEKNKEKDTKKRLRIDEIDIQKISAEGGAGKKQEPIPSPLEISIKNKLSDFYNIEQSNINISIQGG